LAFGLFSVFGLLFSVAAVSAAPVNFDIPAQPAPAALDLFIKQSGAQVVYLLADVKDVKANAVKGAYEPAAALDLVLKDTGLSFTERKPGQFSVGRIAPKTASIKGSLLGEGGKPLTGVLVAIRGTGLSASTDSDGEYLFPEVDAGTYILVATAPGYQPLHIVDVTVKAGRDLTLGNEEMRKPLGNVTLLDPIVVKADATTELEKLEVTGTKEKPFQGANMDIPRTINDAQPYYIFDSKTIEQSGATNVEDLLKKKLTMNAAIISNNQLPGNSNAGNTSSINLRGLGADKTLVLVNGRRVAAVTVTSSNGGQPDLNGIPLSAIDRIEVLPSSASGIYGGSAIGGVVNIILKKDYSGGEIRATYDNTFDTDSPIRTVSINYGFALEGGKTHVMLGASWSDAQPLLLQDRRGIYDDNLATINRNDPGSLATNSRFPGLGTLPNIVNSPGGFGPDGFVPANLILKPAYGGTTLSSGRTYIPAGTSATTDKATLGAALVANAGSQNVDLPASTQSPTGLLRPFGVTPKNKAFQASVNRQMTSNLELFADFSYGDNSTKTVYNSVATAATVSAASPINPFTTAVRILWPDTSTTPATTSSVTEGFTVGAIAHLPWGWTGELDYSWSKNRYQYGYTVADSGAVAAALASGAYNPFVDTLLYPINSSSYLSTDVYDGAATLGDVALRGSGPLWSLPWGAPNLTVGLEHRIAGNSDATDTQTFPVTTANDNVTTYFGRAATTDSIYGELTIPLAKKDVLPFVHALELQFSGRGERYSVETGTPYYRNYFNNPARSFYPDPTLNGVRYDTKTSYTSTNGTVGLKYQPVPDLTLRVSLASAFLPPAPSDLVKNPEVTPFGDFVNGGFVDTISGGNPDLKPQTSKSFNAGIIWEPQAGVMKGLRLDAEYYKIDQKNSIAYLSAQTIVDNESLYPGRVTRDSSGNITLVDTSAVNLYKRETEGWDLSADYTFKTGIGTFNLMAVESIILHLKNQYDQTLPEYDAVNFPSEAGAAKYKANATLTWEWHNWTASWTTIYYGSYKQYGAVGGPDSVQFNGGAQDDTYITPQGSDTIPSQTYSDLFVGYAFGKQHAKTDSRLSKIGAAVLDGLTVQVGVRNVFDKVPPLDVYYLGNYYESPYGDMRMRSYWITVKKAF
jgi:outer membrane receptor protein involved in Fe transport